MNELVSELERSPGSPVSAVDERLHRALLERQEARSAARELSEKLEFLASHDALTGLLNRYEFERLLTRLLDQADEPESEHALCYLDLDQFRVINDHCGHDAGDELLRQLGCLMLGQVARHDVVARLGGDEFGVLIESCSLSRAKKVAEGLLRAIADFRFEWQGKSFSVGVSIGLVPIAGVSESVTGILRAADSACYVAKEEGRNRIQTYRTDDADLLRRSGEMRWVNRIRLALEEDRFQLDFQPIVDITKPEATGGFFELLVRMEDESGRRVSPDLFLPAAERYNLATRIDTWVLGRAFEWLEGRAERSQTVGLCSINLSGQSLGDLDLLRFILCELEERSLRPETVCFEITETAAIANLSQANRFIRTLRTLGCRFALDDFGTGFSSFAYLKSLPVDFLKIDGMFVIDVVKDRFDLAVIRSIVEIGRVTGKQIVAESVESRAILKKLQKIGVDYVQGNGICRPQPLETFAVSEEAGSLETAVGESRHSSLGVEQLNLPFR